MQRAGDRVRINVQLIDAATDEHLWAETYDRQLTASNIFEIQTEIVRAIAAKLEAAYLGADVDPTARALAAVTAPLLFLFALRRRRAS